MLQKEADLNWAASLALDLIGAYAIKAHSDSGDVTNAGLTRNDRASSSIDARSDSGDVALRAR